MADDAIENELSTIYGANGQGWLASNLQQRVFYNKIIYANSLYVVNNDKSYAVSTDGITFGNNISFNEGLNINRIRYGNGYWISGSSDGSIYYTQNINTSNWTKATINLDSNIKLNSVNDMAYGGPVGTWIAIGRGSISLSGTDFPRVVLIYSKDNGLNWNNMSSANFLSYDASNESLLTNMAIIYANYKFSVVGGGSLVDGTQTATYISGADETGFWSSVPLQINSANAISYRGEQYLIGGQNVNPILPTIARSINNGVEFTYVDAIVNIDTGQKFIVNGIA